MHTCLSASSQAYLLQILCKFGESLITLIETGATDLIQFLFYSHWMGLEGDESFLRKRRSSIEDVMAHRAVKSSSSTNCPLSITHYQVSDSQVSKQCGQLIIGAQFFSSHINSIEIVGVVPLLKHLDIIKLYVLVGRTKDILS